ncbi:hypothetical protein LC608_26550 [Nostoc sp. XA010]|uniref:hypothetical protein n=1 Tax=Nostoc sp. XA010 TaxID=2780407 RepID=UPI001E4CB2D1|nr:hypothetical protein [Nostoc sp. XA010]MCC5660475.1 hypothetical protein [Nostoc sp. XA010]
MGNETTGLSFGFEDLHPAFNAIFSNLRFLCGHGDRFWTVTKCRQVWIIAKAIRRSFASRRDAHSPTPFS